VIGDDVIGNPGGLTKTGAGTLILTRTNTYTGGTALNAGVLSVSSDANLGASSGALSFNGGTLQVTGTAFTSTSRPIHLGTRGGTFDIVDGNASLRLDQSLTGTGALTKEGAGVLDLIGVNAYTGGTHINAGLLAISSNASLA
jgi:autotransporter-associated beta strand protein